MPLQKDDYKDKPLDHPLAERCLFHMCITFLFAVLSQSKREGKGVRYMLLSVKWQGGVCERMLRTIFAK